MERLFKTMELPHDKALHALYCLIIYNVMSIIFNDFTALITVVIIAILKEVYDYISGTDLYVRMGFTRAKHGMELNDIMAGITIPFILYAMHMFKITY